MFRQMDTEKYTFISTKNHATSPIDKNTNCHVSSVQPDDVCHPMYARKSRPPQVIIIKIIILHGRQTPLYHYSTHVGGFYLITIG
jgi:hypothetical protein